MDNKKNKDNKDADHIDGLIPFQWGGTTPQWEDEAQQVMQFLRDKLEQKETDEEKKNKIRYGERKQYW